MEGGARPVASQNPAYFGFAQSYPQFPDEKRHPQVPFFTNAQGARFSDSSLGFDLQPPSMQQRLGVAAGLRQAFEHRLELVWLALEIENCLK